jgi:hypothetical protein
MREWDWDRDGKGESGLVLMDLAEEREGKWQ